MRRDIPTTERREFAITRKGIDENKRTVDLSFSSEVPYERGWGFEILSHAPGAMRTTRLEDGAALLVNHDPNAVVGVVESASVSTDRKGRARVRFGTGKFAREVFQDVLDGIRTKVSVGYRIHELVLEKHENGVETYRVTDWEPYEISLVAVPADASVGVGRSTHGEKSMDTIQAGAPAQSDDKSAQREADIRHILLVGQRFNKMDWAHTAIKEGWSPTQFNEKMLELVETRADAYRVRSPAADMPFGSSMGRSVSEVPANFSLLRLLDAMANPGDRKKQFAAGLEFEVVNASMRSDGIERPGKRANAITLPLACFAPMRRDLTVGTATAGGNLVSTEVLLDQFIDILRARSLVGQLGAQVLNGLSGNVAIPRKTATGAVGWIAEHADASETQLAVDQVTLSPKTVAAYTDVSRRLMIQTSREIEQLVRRDLMDSIASALDLAAISGSGSSNQPRGILNTVGIGSVAGGTNGAAPTWDHIVDLEAAVANANADMGTLGFLTNSKVRAKLRKTERFAGTNGEPVWMDAVTREGLSMLSGYRAGVSNQVPSNLTKGTAVGVCSAIIFGNWSDVMIGMWSDVDILVDQTSLSTKGGIRITAFLDADIAIRHPESFAAMQDALTA